MKARCIAHRGYHANCFENSIQAFHAAIDGNYYAIETDVYLTKDKKWIINHNPSFTSNGKEYIIKKEQSSLLTTLPIDNNKGYQAKSPTLSDFLDTISSSNKKAIIEIKPKNPSISSLKKLIKEIEERFDLDNVIFVAFYPWPLLKLKYLLKQNNIQLLVEKSHIFLVKWAYKLGWDINVQANCVNEKMIKKYHSKKLKIGAWTVNDKKELQRLEKIKVDYITTDTFDQNS